MPPAGLLLTLQLSNHPVGMLEVSYWASTGGKTQSSACVSWKIIYNYATAIILMGCFFFWFKTVCIVCLYCIYKRKRSMWDVLTCVLSQSSEMLMMMSADPCQGRCKGCPVNWIHLVACLCSSWDWRDLYVFNELGKNQNHNKYSWCDNYMKCKFQCR